MQRREFLAGAGALATGGYGSVFFQSTLARNSNASATWRAHLRGAHLASPSFVQFYKLPANRIHGVVTRVEL